MRYLPVNHKIVHLAVVLLLSFSVAQTFAQSTFTQLEPVDLYQDGNGPGWQEWAGNLGIKDEVYMGGAARAVYNVTIPTYTPYLPSKETNTKTAVIIAPGGGFRLLAMGHEGYEVAEWLAERGIAAFVLKYRLVQLKSLQDFGTSGQQIPIDEAGVMGVTDGIHAINMIRERASEYNIDPNRIGMIGFSAGAHVAAMAGLNENVEARPNFVGPIYGAAFGDMPNIPKADSENELPPFFIASSINDPTVKAELVMDFAKALFAAGYTPELHLFKDGGHGFGMTRQGTSSDMWKDEFYWWLKTQNLVQKPGEPEHEITMMPGPNLRGS